VFGIACVGRRRELAKEVSSFDQMDALVGLFEGRSRYKRPRRGIVRDTVRAALREYVLPSYGNPRRCVSAERFAQTNTSNIEPRATADTAPRSVDLKWHAAANADHGLCICFWTILSASVRGVDHRQVNRRRAMIRHRLFKAVHDAGFRICAKA
jgi:hypothetical protein